MELLRDWAFDRIFEYGEYGEYSTLTEEEQANMEKAKEFILARLGKIDEGSVHSANQKLDSRLTVPRY